MSNIETIKSFNALAEEFFSRMEQTFPDETKITIYKNIFLGMKINIKKPVEMFMETLLPYGKEIMTRDEEFFMQKEHVDKAQSFSGKMGLVDRWINLSDGTKNSIWQYVQNLYILGLSALELNEILDSVAKHFKNQI